MKQSVRSLLTVATTTLVGTSSIRNVAADEYTHRYKAGDKVDLWVNKVSAYALLFFWAIGCWADVRWLLFVAMITVFIDDRCGIALYVSFCRGFLSSAMTHFMV